MKSNPWVIVGITLLMVHLLGGKIPILSDLLGRLFSAF